VIAATLLSLALAAAQPPDDASGWRTETAGESVAWGAADGAGNGIRIRCRPGGRLEMFGPATPDALPGTPTRVTFRRGEENVTLLAVTVDGDSGPEFSIPLAAGELPIATLLAGANLTIGVADESREVPGAGAPAVLAPLVESCARQAG
jgi:hypothetical protein